MNCPVCNIPLAITERQGVEIDYCQKCRGVWLDRGELDKIIERSEREEWSPPPPPPPPGEPQYGQKEYREPRYEQKPHKKKKSFLTELFELGE